jgi:DNA repair protein RadC
MKSDHKLSEIKLYYKPRNTSKPKISSAEDAYTQVLRFFDKITIALQEQFVVLYLNRANLLLGAHQVFTGGPHGHCGRCKDHPGGSP